MSFRTIVWNCAALAVAACGGGDGGTDVTPPNYSINLSTSTSDVTLQVGGTAIVTVTLTRGGNYGGVVSFAVEGLPAYVEATFEPSSLAGTTTQTTTLTLRATAQMGAGSYPLTIRASGSQVTEARATISCNVQLVADFGLSVTPGTIPAEPGSTVQVIVKLSRSGNFTGGVTLTVENVPAGVSPTFAPNPVMGDSAILTFVVGAAVQAGTHSLNVRGTSAGMADRTVALMLEVMPAGGYYLSIAPATLTLNAPGSAVATVKVHRSSSFTAAVNLFPEQGPNGVTITTSPEPAAGNTTITVTFVASATAVGGTYAMSFRGEAAGQPERRVSFQLVVVEAAGFSISPSSASVTVQAGGVEQRVVYTIARRGGFTGDVAFTATGAPSGVTATFSPASTSGTQLTLTITAQAGTAAQTFTATVHATGPGVAEQTATVTVNVVVASTNVVWRFCGLVPQPVFFAYQDGTSPYVVVTAAADGSFTTPIASARAAVAFVLPEFEPPVSDRRAPWKPGAVLAAARAALAGRSTGAVPTTGVSATSAAAGYTTHVFHGNAGELQAAALEACAGPLSVKTLNGSVASVPAEDAFGVALGTALFIGMPGASSSFTLLGVPDGIHDLIAARVSLVEGAQDITVTPNRMITRRGLNPADGSTLPVLDFGSIEAFDPVSATLTLSATGGAAVETESIIVTANGTYVAISGEEPSQATSRPFYGMPAAKLIAGDLHGILAGDDQARAVLAFRHDVAPWNVAFGPTIPVPLVDVYTVTPVLRMRARITPGAATTGYGGWMDATFVQADLQRAILMHFAESALAASPNFELRTPVFAGLSGWDESLYGLQLGSLLAWGIEAMSTGAFVPADGAVLRMVTFAGQITP